MSTLDVNVGSLSWKNKTLKEIQGSREAAMRAENACRLGTSLNPLPNLRDTLAESSNTEAIKHYRETREVVFQLRDSLMETNDEIKSLTRCKTNLEKTWDNVSKDCKLNQLSAKSRIARPSREKERDVADDLLHGEKMHLQNMKRALEIQLRNSNQQLQSLDQARRKLNEVMQERTRVLELVCHRVPIRPKSSTMGLQRSNTHIGVLGKQSSMSNDLEGTPLSFVDFSETTTPESNNAMSEAKVQRERSSEMRKEVNEMIRKTENSLKAVMKSVNNGILKKISESYMLKQQLINESENNRNTLNKAQRYYNNTEKSFYFSKGPVSRSDLAVREKFDRPIIQVYNRHNGNNIEEMYNTAKGGKNLFEALKATNINLQNVELAGMQIKADINDKKSAIAIDSNLIRDRRRKADHRWVPQHAY